MPATARPATAQTMRETVASNLDALAETMQRDIDAKRAPLTQNPTPRRIGIKEGQRRDADRLEEVQRALRALAEGHRRGDLPGELAGLQTRTSVADVLQGWDRTPIKDRRRESLRKMLERAKTDADREADERVARRKAIEAAENAVRFVDIPGFFPTPPALASQLVTWADIPEDEECSILEPSAGIGSIVEAIETQRPKALVHSVEINYSLCEVLKAKGISHERMNIMDTGPTTTSFYVDRVVMNPPFERCQDAEHVMHCYGMLKPGGRLVAVVSAGTLTMDRYANFRAWLDEKDHRVEIIEPGAFKGPRSFRQTSVNVAVVIIDK